MVHLFVELIIGFNGYEESVYLQNQLLKQGQIKSRRRKKGLKEKEKL